jgi:hypothetical protein
VNNWPFKETPQWAVFAPDRIMQKSLPILHIYHDTKDNWFFLPWEIDSDQDMPLVALQDVMKIDSTVGKASNLPPGWHAWRKTRKHPWKWTDKNGVIPHPYDQ